MNPCTKHWTTLIERALTEFATPFYLYSWPHVLRSLAELEMTSETSVRHWLSFKTSPVAHLVRAWKDLGLGVEVVSEFEFLAATREGFPEDRILVNGVAKHRWLGKYKGKKLRVNFDSLTEVRELHRQARQDGWDVGLRFHTSVERDPDEPQFATQFGMTPTEISEAARLLHDSEVKVKAVHFHLRSNVADPQLYRAAISEATGACRAFGITPCYFDVGGGLPVEGEWPCGSAGTPLFDLAGLKAVICAIPDGLPSVREIWMENGRFVTARSAVLVTRVLDVKERSDCRFLICDGGRTNHALVSDWECHSFSILPSRAGRLIPTTVCGSTCMAWDRLFRAPLPESVQPGDCIVWENAGAYHIPWENHFSNGLALVLWSQDGEKIVTARTREAFSEWWGRWQKP